VRIKVQLPFLVLLALIACAAPAGAAQYTVVTCNGQAAATGGWSLFASGPDTALSENCAASGGSMAAVLTGNQTPAASNAGWQVFAPANTTIAGATIYRKVGVAGTSYGYVARGITPAAANYQVFETCSGPADCKEEIARTSVPWISARADVNRIQVYVQCPSASCQKLTGGEAAAVRISRADIALTDNAAPTISAGPTSPMFSSGASVSGVQSIAVTFKDLGGGVAATGIQVDGQTVSETPVPNAGAARPIAGWCRARSPSPRPCSSNPASVPDGPHQVRVFARDATGANVGYSASFPVTTSARGAVNGTNGSDQVKLTLGVRRAVGAGHRAPTPHTTLDVPYNAKTVAQGRLVNSAGQPVTGARLTVGTAVDRGGPELRRSARRRGHRCQRPLQGDVAARPVVARARPLLRARPGLVPGQHRQRPRAGRDARDVRPTQAPHAPRAARRLPAGTWSAATARPGSASSCRGVATAAT
jgi:hypothetical protein